MGTRYLEGTIWRSVYSIFGSSVDSELCKWMSTIGLAYTAVVGIYSIFFPAPYGRHSSSKFGPTFNAKLAWIIQESPALLVPTALILTTPRAQLTNPPNVIALSVFVLHYLHRAIIYPVLNVSGKARQVPISTAANAFIFCFFNGFLQGHHVINTFKIVSSSWAEIAGLSLFFVGMATNIWHDRALVNLKKQAKLDKDGNTEYEIPLGGLFQFITSPNYFGEIVEWWGLALYTQAYPQIVFALFTTTFLGLRGFHHHQWCLNHFGDKYPRNRKAVIPYIF